MPIRSPNWSRDYKSFYFQSKSRDRPKVDPWQDLRARTRTELSLPAQLKLEWVIFYHTSAGKNATATATHFGITRRSVHKWLKRFKEYGLAGLEESSRDTGKPTWRDPDRECIQSPPLLTLDLIQYKLLTLDKELPATVVFCVGQKVGTGFELRPADHSIKNTTF
jgi:transposase-like protein